MGKEDLVVGFASKKIPCEKCVFGISTSPYYKFCAKYKNKPNDIFCDGANCKYFKSIETARQERQNERG